MTIYPKRRGRRSLAAILAAMLVASVLAVVAGTPAQAANTSGEYLIDHDDNAKTPTEREFEGRDRYDTALRLAKRFAGDRGGVGTVANAFVASGESLVDAVSVAGLAGFLDAPVLLTRRDKLHGGVKDFIEDYGIGNIRVLGGNMAVSLAVEEELRDLANKPNVTRIEGDDRYETSAEIASELSGESWCGTNETSAIVASGANEHLFDAIAIGPVANRLELPVLLSASDGLVSSVIDYIDTEKVEYVVIVGDNVSADVEQALRDEGVDTVQRIKGNSPAELSVAIAELAANGCGDDLSPVSNTAVALVNSTNMIDGITAAPVLADDTDQLGGGLIPILAVGDSLPASVREYLAGTPSENAGGDKLHMRVLAVGGTTAVSDAVVKAAVDAASSAPQLTVTIGTVGTNDQNEEVNDYAKDGTTPILVAGRSMLRLSFSDDIDQATAANLRNKLEDILQVNDIPADISAQSTTDTSCKPDGVTVTLEGRKLKAGDVISIVEGTVLVGAGGDRRAVAPTSATVPAATADTQRPAIRVLAFTGHEEVYGLVSDNVALANTANTLLAGSLNNEDGDANFEVIAPTSRKDVLADFSSGGVTGFTAGSKSALLTFDLDGDEVVKTGDRFRANRGAVVDTASPRANESQVTTASAIAPVSKLQVSSVLMSDFQHGTATQQAKIVIPSAHEDEDAPDTSALANPAVWLRAKPDGAAAGAYGNLWSVRSDRASTWSAAKAVDIDVFVSTKDRRIVVRIVNGEPKFADLKAALEADKTVNGLFDVLVDNAPTAVDGDTDSCRPANLPLRHADLPQSGTETDSDDDDTVSLTGGRTSGTIAVNFNGWVEAIADDESGRLMTHVLADALKRLQKVNSAATQDTLLTALGTTLTATSFTKTKAAGPKKTLEVTFTTGNAVALPLPRDLVIIPDGFRKCTSANEDTRNCAKGGAFDGEATAGIQRTEVTTATDETAIANGYGDNSSTQTTENDFNYGSRPRITRNSSVTKPAALPAA